MAVEEKPKSKKKMKEGDEVKPKSKKKMTDNGEEKPKSKKKVAENGEEIPDGVEKPKKKASAKKKKALTKKTKGKKKAMPEYDTIEANDGSELLKISPSFTPTVNDGYVLIDRVETKNGKRLLHEMNVLFPEGTVTAVMGPSGAGKSTFLNVVTDSLSINSIGVAEVHLPGMSSFVPQEDQLHGFFTVNSYMHHYARLTGLKLPKQQLDEKINKLLGQLGLTEQKNTIVGDLFFKGLSGGQKRRLSIALEALSDPVNFYLDEPTSGLDAESALQVMEFLKLYAREASGRRVIVTIHQPSSFIWQIIDNVVLLSKGKLMYQGSRSNMEAYFESNGHPTPPNWNPADHYVTMVNDEFRNHAASVDEWADHYNAWIQGHHLGGPDSSAYFDPPKHQAARAMAARTPSMTKVSLREGIETQRSHSIWTVGPLLYRYFLNLWFNPGILFTRVAMYTMLALMVGALFWGVGNQTDYESITARTAILCKCLTMTTIFRMP